MRSAQYIARLTEPFAPEALTDRADRSCLPHAPAFPIIPITMAYANLVSVSHCVPAQQLVVLDRCDPETDQNCDVRFAMTAVQ
jgi:hypothetical protein